jgi:hypothetical protein
LLCAARSVHDLPLWLRDRAAPIFTTRGSAMSAASDVYARAYAELPASRASAALGLGAPAELRLSKRSVGGHRRSRSRVLRASAHGSAWSCVAKLHEREAGLRTPAMGRADQKPRKCDAR